MRAFVSVTLLLLAAGLARAQDCGYPNDQPGRFGPFDYSDPTLEHERYLVDGAHFTPYMEEMALYGFSSRKASAQEAEGAGLIGGNLDYTLYAFPNHTRALYAMGIWQLNLRQKSMREYEGVISGSRVRPAECYFERAIMFKPTDGMVHLAYGAFLHKARDLKKAVVEYQKALELMPGNSEINYNLGLLYLDLHDIAKAAEQADIAYGLGYPLQGLRNRLARAQAQSRGSAVAPREPAR